MIIHRRRRHHHRSYVGVFLCIIYINIHNNIIFYVLYFIIVKSVLYDNVVLYIYIHMRCLSVSGPRHFFRFLFLSGSRCFHIVSRDTIYAILPRIYDVCLGRAKRKGGNRIEIRVKNACFDRPTSESVADFVETHRCTSNESYDNRTRGKKILYYSYRFFLDCHRSEKCAYILGL